MKLVNGKDFVVYFGCLPIVNQNQRNSQKEQEARNQVDIFIDNQREEIVNERNKIIEELNKNKEVLDVTDLFTKLPSDIIFNPIYFKMHLPLSLQMPDYIQSEKTRALTEDFECVYDGGILYIATLCDADKIPFGAFDVRNRIIKILESFVEIKVVAPCMYSKPFTFTLSSNKSDSRKDKSLFRIEKETTTKKLIKKLYESFWYELRAFCDICAMTTECNQLGERIENDKVKLLKKMTESRENSWKKKIWFNTTDLRGDIIKILSNVSKYLSIDNLRKGELRNFIMFLSDHPIMDMVDLKSIKFYSEPIVNLDVTSTIKTLEIVRSELESHMRNRYALLSALTGALVGSIFTLILSHL